MSIVGRNNGNFDLSRINQYSADEFVQLEGYRSYNYTYRPWNTAI